MHILCPHLVVLELLLIFSNPVGPDAEERQGLRSPLIVQENMDLVPPFSRHWNADREENPTFQVFGWNFIERRLDGLWVRNEAVGADAGEQRSARDMVEPIIPPVLFATSLKEIERIDGAAPMLTHRRSQSCDPFLSQGGLGCLHDPLGLVCPLGSAALIHAVSDVVTNAQAPCPSGENVNPSPLSLLRPPRCDSATGRPRLNPMWGLMVASVQGRAARSSVHRQLCEQGPRPLALLPAAPRRRVRCSDRLVHEVKLDTGGISLPRMKGLDDAALLFVPCAAPPPSQRRPQRQHANEAQGQVPPIHRSAPTFTTPPDQPTVSGSVCSPT